MRVLHEVPRERFLSPRPHTFPCTRLHMCTYAYTLHKYTYYTDTFIHRHIYTHRHALHIHITRVHAHIAHNRYTIGTHHT